MMFFIFERMTYWRIRPGQLTIEHLIGGGAESFDTNALRFQKLNSFFSGPLSVSERAIFRQLVLASRAPPST
jgi:hypothetical protein